MAKRKRPPSEPEPAPTWPPCPRCKGPTTEKITRDGKPLMEDLAEKHRAPALAGVPVILCRSCRVIASHVAGIVDEWRDAGTPGLSEILARDALDGLRQRRFQDAEPGDPGIDFVGIF